MSHRFFPLGSSRLAVGLAVLLAISGCSSSKKAEGRKEVFPVRGKLLVNDQPAPGAMLVLHPVGGSFEAERPSATVGPDGTFELTTYNGKDGAPAGEYIVTAQWYLAADQSSPGPWPNVLPTKYATPDSSDVRVQIAAGPNELQPIAIRR